MRLRQIRKGVTTRRDAVRGDHATLQSLEIESAKRERRPSRYRPASEGRSAGVLPSAAYGIALRNFVPEAHMATSFDEIRKGRDGLHYYRLPDVEIDVETGDAIERPDLPTSVNVDGTEVVVERVGVEMSEDDFEVGGAPEISKAAR